MNSIIKVAIATTAAVLISLPSFAQKHIDAKSRQVLDDMISVVGSYDALRAKGDVEFDYVYDNFDQGKDVSQEKLIFDGEASWARYTQHDRNVLPGQDGIVEQSLMGGKAQMTLNGKFIKDEKAIGATVFIREVNPYWFTMIYKLEDNSTIYKHMGTETVNGIDYDKISLTYDNGMTKKPADDEYILYFNQKTHMLDLFYFSLPAFGVQTPILRMELTYENFDGIYIPTKRKSFGPNPATGEYVMNGEYTFKNIKFNNGFKVSDFALNGK